MTDWATEWQALRKNFCVLTKERFKTMEALMHKLAGPEPGRDDLEELNRHFHSLKGVGASYGYPGISTLGKYSQQECRNLLDQGKMLSAEDLERLRERLNDMKKEMDAGGTCAKPE